MIYVITQEQVNQLMTGGASQRAATICSLQPIEPLTDARAEKLWKTWVGVGRPNYSLFKAIESAITGSQS